MTRISITSDTHGKHWQMPEMPEADIFIHAGDFMNSGRYEDEITSFNSWLESIPLPKERKLICGGNHDIRFDETHRESSPRCAAQARALLTNGTYLQDEATVLDGVKFWFSPHTPEFLGWGFNAKRGEEISAKWKMIPDDTQFLITHGPPMGILDKSQQWGDNLGCADLLSRIRELSDLRYHIFGHIHGGRGRLTVDKTEFINASFLDETYKPWAGKGAILLEV